MPSDTFLSTTLQLLILPKEFYLLGTKHSNNEAMGVILIQTTVVGCGSLDLTQIILQSLKICIG